MQGKQRLDFIKNMTVPALEYRFETWTLTKKTETKDMRKSRDEIS
jgi:hypothetical protein